MVENNIKGKVYLIGAGPGDPDLLTIKAADILQRAEVVLVDRLVSDDILVRFVSRDAEVLHVGKECRRGASTPQSLINELLVSYALQGKMVVRLKGGDVSFFSNVLDELQALKAQDINYEVIPGITAASGASAYSGIPLTARGYATAVRFLTYYKSDVVPETYWAELASTPDTLVFYMSVATLPAMIGKLVSYNISCEKKVAVIEQATTPNQKVHLFNFNDVEFKLKERSFASPSLVIIGKVVALHDQFKWLQNAGTDEFYFKPVTKIQEENNLRNAV